MWKMTPLACCVSGFQKGGDRAATGQLISQGTLRRVTPRQAEARLTWRCGLAVPRTLAPVSAGVGLSAVRSALGHTLFWEENRQEVTRSLLAGSASSLPPLPVSAPARKHSWNDLPFSSGFISIHKLNRNHDPMVEKNSNSFECEKISLLSMESFLAVYIFIYIHVQARTLYICRGTRSNGVFAF